MSSVLRPPAPQVEPLDDRSRAELIRLADQDPYVNAVIRARLHATGGLDPRRLGGTVLATRDTGGRLTGAVFAGGNLLPVGGGPDEWRTLAGHLLATPRPCSSIIGRASAVDGLWQVLSRAWGRPRAVRAEQPLLVLDQDSRPGRGDRRVRRIRRDELDRYVPAAAAMFAEELGISPYRVTSAADYRRRVAGIVDAGRAFGIIDGDGEVIFKADIGAVSPHTCQLQGVWVRPELRGRGIGRAALAEVLREALTLAPTVSLYVNDFNTPARRMYERLGMRPVATLSTILF